MLILYHGSEADFKEFDQAYQGLREDGASNGALGIWMFVREQNAEQFCHVYEVHANFRNVYRMSVEDLRHHHYKCGKHPNGEKAYYADLREYLSSQGYDSVAIVETDGSIGMYVGLHTNALSIADKRYLVTSPNL